MRIGISTSVIQRGQTGVGQYLLALLRALLKEGPQHRYIVFVLQGDLPFFSFAKDRVTLVQIAERFRPPVRDIVWHQTRLPALVRQLRLDVLHIPSYRRLLWSKPCTLVATIHDLAPFRISRKYDWKRMFYGRFVVPHLARRQDEIIATSENTAKDLRQFFRLPRERLTVVYNGLEHTRFSPDGLQRAKSDAATRYGLDGPFFLYVARLEHPAKNHLSLLAAFEEFKAATRSRWQLALAGSDWHGAQTIHQAIRSSPCVADIRCLGFVPDIDLPNLYRAADVFVYPSLYEGFGLPPLEAMACGTPVICSTRGSLSEVVGGAAATIVPEDYHTIAKQLYVLATDDGQRNRLRAAGLAQARKFDWPRTAQETLKVYERSVLHRTEFPPQEKEQAFGAISHV
jgi:glycosyltransferase involved in cell wall biosynthesis